MQYIFTSYRIGFLKHGILIGLACGLERQLRDAISVAQVYESHATHFADSLNPSGECYRFSHVGET